MFDILTDKLLDCGYEIEIQIGRGANATTYRSVALKTNKKVAIKVISLRQVKDWKIIELFEREAKVLSSLHHPYIPRYLDYLTIDTPTDLYFCIIQELAIGESLERLCQQDWQPDESEIKHIALQLLEILVYLHELTPPIIHRDIKPANIIYQPDRKKIFLVDFGAVQAVYRNTFSHGLTFVGTMGFIAAEQYNGQVSFASDLYSLGATIVYLITGMNPVDIPQKRLQIDWLRVTTIDISSEFSNWLDNLLQPIPEERGASTRDCLAVLKGEKKSNFSLQTQPPSLRLLDWQVIRNRDKFFAKAKLKELNFTECYSWIPINTYLYIASICLAIILTLLIANVTLLYVPIFHPLFNISGLPLCYIFALSVLKYLVYRWLRICPYLIVEVDRYKFKLVSRGKIVCDFPVDEIAEKLHNQNFYKTSVFPMSPEECVDLVIRHGLKKYTLTSDKLLNSSSIFWLLEEINSFLGNDRQGTIFL